jgi:hypothetical protein
LIVDGSCVVDGETVPAAKEPRASPKLFELLKKGIGKCD